VVASAYGHELPRFGVKGGLTNYAAAYCTGLLLARRHLKKLNLDGTYKGLEEATGAEYYVEKEGDNAAPFRCVLDVGLARTSTGAKIFAAMKGVADGGCDVPHRYTHITPSIKHLSRVSLCRSKRLSFSHFVHTRTIVTG
jgi:large subunit ribosomal protein L5e